MKEAVEVQQLKDINALYAQIRRDGNFLENIDKTPFIDTPLHASATTGNTDLVMEITRLKPSFTRKLNPDGFSPLHLALQNGQTETALKLIDVDPELVRVKGREGITPLHYASEKGDIYLLVRFLSVCPKSTEDVTNQGETALHIALKNDKVEAFEVLTRRPPWSSSEESQYCNKRIFNWKDKDGNTLLHIATSKNQLQVVKRLLYSKADVNARNLDGWTPLDILLNQTEPINEEIKNTLDDAGAVEATSLPITDSHTYTHLLRGEQILNQAARVGNVDAIYDLLLEDVHLLNRIDEIPFIDTPLHIAASAGHVPFALEIMRLKPSFARKQNQYGFSPLHLALRSTPSQTEMALRLILVDSSLIRVQGKGGITPLHYLAGKGYVDLLSKFIVACPDCIQDVTVRKENALHFAAKSGKFEALNLLINWIHYVGKDKILKQTDDEGNNLLHIAVNQSHIQMVKLLINRVPINVPNSLGITVLDILEDHIIQGLPLFEKLKLRLCKACAREGSSFPNLKPAQALTKRLKWLERKALFNYRRKVCITNENREAVLVVAVLIATATYQAALSPSQFEDPIGKWSGASPADYDEYYAYNEEHHSHHVFSIHDLQTWSYQIFLYLNIVAFCISMSVIHNFLPQANARLVYPIILCFLSLMAIRSYISLTGSIVILLGIWSPSFVPAISRNLYCFRGYQAVRPIFKHYRRSE